jgi:Asp-tRNA(Asn)/Glu-tRNA(Gln) amidotransferase A subunit family amidase
MAGLLSGWPSWSSSDPRLRCQRTDVVVERLKAAGAVILGKTTVPELGYSGAS